MLRSLRIQGFRAFQNFEVPNLSRINLLVGKNNVGKTTVLEALDIFASGLDAPQHIRKLLQNRNEYLRQAIQEGVSWDMTRIFNDRAVANEVRQEFEIGEVVGDNKLTFKSGWIIDTALDEQSRRRSFSEVAPIDSSEANSTEVRPGFFIGVRGETRLIPIDWIDRSRIYPPMTSRANVPSCFVPIGGISDGEVAKLWDSVVLTEFEDLVLEALRIIEPDLERVVIIEPNNARADRIALVKNRKKDVPVSLRSLGDGMSRIFQLVLALVNSKGGILLVDEIDNGIHYSAQEELWKVIFMSAAKLDLQVFATTHSWDCIKSFQTAASASPEDGSLVRLSKHEDDIFASVFSEKDLEIVTRESVEIR